MRTRSTSQPCPDTTRLTRWRRPGASWATTRGRCRSGTIRSRRWITAPPGPASGEQPLLLPRSRCDSSRPATIPAAAPRSAPGRPCCGRRSARRRRNGTGRGPGRSAGHGAAAENVIRRGERAAIVREQVRLVQGHHRQLPGVAAAIEQQVNLVPAKVAGEADMTVDLRRVDAGQVTAREAFEDVRQLVGGEVGRPTSPPTSCRTSSKASRAVT